MVNPSQVSKQNYNSPDLFCLFVSTVSGFFSNEIVLHGHQHLWHHDTTGSDCFNCPSCYRGPLLSYHVFEAVRLKAPLTHKHTHTHTHKSDISSSISFYHQLIRGHVRKHINIHMAAIADKVRNFIKAQYWDGHISPWSLRKQWRLCMDAVS